MYVGVESSRSRLKDMMMGDWQGRAEGPGEPGGGGGGEAVVRLGC